MTEKTQEASDSIKLREEERRRHFEKRGAPPVDLLRQRPGFHYLLDSDRLSPWLEEGSRPRYLDIGAGMGRFLMGEAEKSDDVKFLGIDCDYQCVKKNLDKLWNRERQGRKLDHVRYFFGSVYHVLDLLREPCIDRAYVNYPDPWFKKRHLKRRLVTVKLFETLRPFLREGAEVFVQTDIDDYAEFMEEQFKEVVGYEIQMKADALFEGLTGTLYQEKAQLKGHSRHCYVLKRK